MVSEEKKQRFSQLLKYIRGTDGVKQFAARLSIKLPTYSAWETARAFPNAQLWEVLLPQLCLFSGLTPQLIDQYLRGDYELTDLVEGAVQEGLKPRTRPIITSAKFRSWLQTLSLTESIEVVQDAAQRASVLAANVPREEAVISEDKTLPNLEHFQLHTRDEDARVSLIFQLIETLSIEKMVQVDHQLRDLIILRLQELGLGTVRKYQHNPFYLLMEAYRLKNNLSYEQFEQQILQQGVEAGLDSERVAKIVQGELLPNNHELLWIGIFIDKPDGSLYDHEELISLRDGQVTTCQNEFKADTKEDTISPQDRYCHPKRGENDQAFHINGKS